MGMRLLTMFLTASVVIVISGSVIIHIIRRRKKSEKPKPKKATEAFNYLEINIVTESVDCIRVVEELRRRSMKHKALGFDCEWVTRGVGRQPVALLQLSSFDGYCGLFRLNHFTHDTIPEALKNLLECGDVYKVGVATTGDVNNIYSDYQIEVCAAIDLRYIAEMCGFRAGGLAAMTEDLLGIALNKYWKVRCSDWEADELTPVQLHYAASDAHAAIRIFVTALNSSWTSQDSRNDVWETMDDICWQFIDRNYTAKQSGEAKQRPNKSKKEQIAKKLKRYANSTRSKPLYHNCFLQAPDGELLCTCDNKKAYWYLEKNLADKISSDPLTVRLRFEPVARSTGEVGEYYRTRKENRCVVCGADNSYIRKNVVPREYRKYFPEIMKEHSSHDVLLLCSQCHQRSNMVDQGKRRQLAADCLAPIADHNPRVFEDAQIKKIRMSARALLGHGSKHSLPEARRRELEAQVAAHFPGRHLSQHLIEEAAGLQSTYTNSEFTAESHGFKVVAWYLQGGGLLALEEEWRRHFLSSMRPRYLPALWSVNHNQERLKIKWEENRLDANDLKSMGVQW